MARKENKIDFNDVMKGVIDEQGLATKQDINRLEKRLMDAIKKEGVKNTASTSAAKGTPQSRKKEVKTSAEVVMNAMKDKKGGTSVKELSEATDFKDKKLRNIIHRLHKEGKIERKDRGVYVPAKSA